MARTLAHEPLGEPHERGLEADFLGLEPRKPEPLRKKPRREFARRPRVRHARVRPGLRPTGDRLRETLFNWLGQELGGWKVLDAFAGSGALGLEAASRGAQVTLVEQDSRALRSLREVVSRLDGAADCVLALLMTAATSSL